MKVQIELKELIGLPGIPDSTAKNDSHKIAKIKIFLIKNGIPVFNLPKTGAPLGCKTAKLPAETRQYLATHNTKIGYDAPVVRAAENHAAKIQLTAEQKEEQRQAARIESMVLFKRLPPWQRKGAEAKLAIIKGYLCYQGTYTQSICTSRETFAAEYAFGRIDVAAWVRVEIPYFHHGTLKEWIDKEYELGHMGLVDMYGNRKGQSKIETNAVLKSVIDSQLDLTPHIKSVHINEFIRAHCPDHPFISTKSIDRYREKRAKADPQRTLLGRNPDKYKSHMQPAFGSRSEGIVALNQLWELDATPADVMLVDGRHSVLGMIDVYSRRMKLLVSKTSRAVMVCTLMRRGMMDFGVPDGVKTDNGKDYTADHFERVLSDLEIDHDLCDPFSGDQKPHIERALKTFSHDLVELLPGYIGHNVAERKEIESRKTFAQRLKDSDHVIEVNLTAAKFQEFCDNWCEGYHRKVHSSLGKSPFVMATEWTMPIRTISDERALDVLLATAPRHGGMRAATKHGIRVDRYWYVDTALIPWIGLGRVLQILHEPEDLGKIIVQGPNEFGVMEHVCVAICPEVLGISRLELARATNEAWKLHTADLRADLKRSKNVLKNAPAAEIIMAARLKDAANVVALPKRTIEYTSPGLTAAGEAARMLDGAPVAPAAVSGLTPEQQAVKERMKQEMEQAKAAGVVNLQVESSKAKYKRFKAMRERLTDEGPVLTEEEYRALAGYEATAEYRAIKGMEEDARAAK